MELRQLDKPFPAENDPDNGTLIDKGLQRRQIQPLRQPIARRQQQKDQNERFEQSQQPPAKFVDQRKELYLFRKKGSENAQQPGAELCHDQEDQKGDRDRDPAGDRLVPDRARQRACHPEPDFQLSAERVTEQNPDCDRKNRPRKFTDSCDKPPPNAE